MSLLGDGTFVKIKSIKHNGKLRRLWENNLVLSETDEAFITVNDKVLVTEAGDRYWRTKDPAIAYFSKTHWFNIVAIIPKEGRHYYYCNLASPVQVKDGAIQYIDYDLDVEVDQSGEIHLLDQDEYEQNSKLMAYPLEVKETIQKELVILHEWAERGKGPFQKDFVQKWFKRYQDLDVKWDVSK